MTGRHRGLGVFIAPLLRRTRRVLQTTIDEEGCGAVFAAARFTTGDDNEKDQ